MLFNKKNLLTKSKQVILSIFNFCSVKKSDEYTSVFKNCYVVKYSDKQVNIQLFYMLLLLRKFQKIFCSESRKQVFVRQLFLPFFFKHIPIVKQGIPSGDEHRFKAAFLDMTVYTALCGSLHCQTLRCLLPFTHVFLPNVLLHSPQIIFP